MTNSNSNEKIIQLLTDNLYPISNSVNTIVDSLMKVIQEDCSEEDARKISMAVMEQLEGTINLLVAIDKELPLEAAKKSDDEILLMYHSAMKHILEGLKIVLSWVVSKEEENKDKIHLAVDNLFEGAQLIVNLVDRLL
ncbi:hypothetical protein P4T04_05060 [Bacillus badius]|uniref:hypothetical protein n=1 Tax=Bacillus badius TaxID=1455 RepID=UPI002E1CFBF1|nr:hypothetical protein [Bacillus badius]